MSESAGRVRGGELIARTAQGFGDAELSHRRYGEFEMIIG
jgi:hypothetical protein